MLIKLDHIYAGYHDSLVLEDVSLVVNEHDFIGVIGPNGEERQPSLRSSQGC